MVTFELSILLDKIDFPSKRAQFISTLAGMVGVHAHDVRVAVIEKGSWTSAVVAPPDDGSPISQVIYSSGTAPQYSPSATGQVSLEQGVTYSVQVEILRNDLGSGPPGEWVPAIYVGSTNIGSCAPDGGDYDCTFFTCPLSFVFTAATSTVALSIDVTGHSWDCDCDMALWACSAENTVGGRTQMTAVARYTFTPATAPPRNPISIINAGFESPSSANCNAFSGCSSNGWCQTPNSTSNPCYLLNSVYSAQIPSTPAPRGGTQSMHISGSCSGANQGGIYQELTGFVVGTMYRLTWDANAGSWTAGSDTAFASA